MCRVLGVAPSGYYEWLTHPISNRAQEDARLLRLIRASFTASQGIYGAPRIFLDLRGAGETCSKHRVARLMRRQSARAARLSHAALVGRQAIGPDPQPPEAAVHGDAPNHGLGHGYQCAAASGVGDERRETAGLSHSACRSRVQTTASGLGQKPRS